MLLEIFKSVLNSDSKENKRRKTCNKSVRLTEQNHNKYGRNDESKHEYTINFTEKIVAIILNIVKVVSILCVLI